MSTQVQPREAVVLTARPSREIQRYMMQPSSITPFVIRDGDDEGEEVLVSGCNQVAIQARLCGDYYVEATGPKFCVSAVNAGVAQALRDALRQTPGGAA